MGTSCRLHSTLAGALPAAPDAAWRSIADLEVATLFAKSRTTQTAAVLLPGAGRIVRKRWTWPRRRDRWKGALRTTIAARSPARREFEALERLTELPDGAFAPQPLAYLEKRERGVLTECLLLLALVEGATDLAKWLASSQPGRVRTQVLARLAVRTRSMHDAGLADFDMHPRNVLVAPEGDVFKVDSPKQRRRRGPASLRDRVRDLAALDVGLSRYVSGEERAAFLREYLGREANAKARAAVDAAVSRERRRIGVREARRLPD